MFSVRFIGDDTTHAPPEQRWPDAQAPLEGRIEARVGTLGIWGSWVPPGWRLAGSLQTQATISGRLGAPAYTGRLEGRGLAVSNLLQGVDVRDGEIDVSLQGERATIERFTARGGDGRVELRGGAEFGAAPVARVQLEAQRFRVLGRADRQLITSGKAALELRAESLKLDGALKVLDLDIGVEASVSSVRRAVTAIMRTTTPPEFSSHEGSSCSPWNPR